MPPAIVHEVGTNTAGSSPADDSGTEVCTGTVVVATVAVGIADPGAALEITVDGEAIDGEAVNGKAVDGGLVIATVDGAALADSEGDAEGDGTAELLGATTVEAFRLPACLPTKKAATHRPMRTTAPRTARFRLRDEVIRWT
jgi:hypothetical protein